MHSLLEAKIIECQEGRRTECLARMEVRKEPGIRSTPLYNNIAANALLLFLSLSASIGGSSTSIIISLG